MAEVQRLLSDKQEQEGAMLQVCICMISLFFRLWMTKILRLNDTYEGPDAGGARTEGNRRCTKVC